MLTEQQFRILQQNQARAAGVEPAKPLEIDGPKFRSKTEARYATYLEALKSAREIRDWKYEAVTFRLGKGVHYTPDFLVLQYDGTDQGYMELHETKGRKGATYYSRPVGKIKVRVAAGMFPMFRFVVVWPERNGEWNKERVSA